MTNKEKFSPVYGFEPGVVVEVTFSRNVANFGPDKPYIFRFKGYSEYEIVILEENNGNELQPYPGEIDSIRILSGPWSSWNFAPDNANWIEFGNGHSIPIMAWVWTESELKSRKDRVIDSLIYLPRPWWATA